MKILSIGASNSAQSINQMLANYAAKSAASRVPSAQVEPLNISDYEMPLFSVEREAELGHPALAQAFHQEIAAADALVISFAEHNGSYTAAFKNLFDWVSRIDKKVYQGKPAVFLSTSLGKRGAASVLDTAVNAAPHFGARLVASLAVPSFHDNFDPDTQEAKNTAIISAIDVVMRPLVEQLSAANHSSTQKLASNPVSFSYG